MHAPARTRSGRRSSGILVAAVLAATAAILPGAQAMAQDATPTGTLRVGIAALSTADTLDPAMATTAGGYAIARQLYDTLVEYGTDGSVVPRLAESVTPGETADVWTVKLREAHWSDGRPVTADDVIASVQRWFSGDEPMAPANSLPFVDPAAITKVDDLTVEFHLKYPTVVFPDALTSPLAAIVPADFDAAAPIGSGPFVLAENDPGVRVTFTANQDYWEAGKPGVAELELISFPDSTSMINALIGDQIDLASSMDPSLVPLVDAAGDGYTVFSYPTSGTLTWQMNVLQEPFDDPLVRQAFRLAVNRQELIDQVYVGNAMIGNDIFSPFDPLYDAALPQREQDVAKAKELLAQAGYPDGVDVELTAAPIQPTAVRQNEVMVQQVKDAGFNVNFNQVDAATYYGDAYGTYPLSLSFWGQLGIFDQAAFTIVNDAPYNATKWQDDEYNALYEEAVRTVDDAKRAELVHQMQQIEYERGPYVVPLFVNNLSAYDTKVTGYQPYPNSDGPSGYNFKDMSIGE